MLEGIEQIPPGSDGLITLPYFAGERTPINDPQARGVLFGLTLGHTRAHLYRSALKAVGYSVAQHFDILAEHGLPLHNMMAVGGGAKNRPWMQIIADITGQPIHTAGVTLGAAYGDALMAALAAGCYQSFADFSTVIQPGESFLPDAGRNRRYAA